MWQFFTASRGDGAAVVMPVEITDVRPLGSVTHGLTHRRYEFEVYACEAPGTNEPSHPPARAWTTLDGLSQYPLPRPHLKIMELLRGR